MMAIASHTASLIPHNLSQLMYPVPLSIFLLNRTFKTNKHTTYAAPDPYVPRTNISNLGMITAESQLKLTLSLWFTLRFRFIHVNCDTVSKHINKQEFWDSTRPATLMNKNEQPQKNYTQYSYAFAMYISAFGRIYPLNTICFHGQTLPNKSCSNMNKYQCFHWILKRACCIF
jgi:hypothetical protein